MFEYSIPLLVDGQTNFKTNFGGFFTILYVTAIYFIITFAYNDFCETRIESQTVFSSITNREFNQSVPEALVSYAKGYDTYFYLRDFPDAKNCTKNETLKFLNSSKEYREDTAYICLNAKSYVEDYRFRYIGFYFQSEAYRVNASVLPELRIQLIFLYNSLDETTFEIVESKDILDLHSHYKNELYYFLSRNYLNLGWIESNEFDSLNLGFKLAKDNTNNYIKTNGGIYFYLLVEEFYEKRINAKRLPELLSIIMAYISIFTLIMQAISSLASDYIHLRFLFEKCVPDQQLLNQTICKTELRPYLSFCNYLISYLPIQTEGSRNFKYIRNISYYHCSIERILKQHYLKELNAKSEQICATKPNLLEKFDFLSKSQPLYINKKENYSNWFSWLITIVSLLLIAACLYLFGRDLISNENPYVYNKMIFTSDMGAEESQIDSRFNKIDELFMITTDSSFFHSTIPYKLGKQTSIFDLMHECSSDELKEFNATKPSIGISSMCFKLRDAMSKEIFSRSYPRFFLVFLRCNSMNNNRFYYGVNDTEKVRLEGSFNACNYTYTDKVLQIDLSYFHTDFSKSKQNRIAITYTILNPLSADETKSNGKSLGIGYVYKTISFDKDIWSLTTNQTLLEENELSALGLIYSVTGGKMIGEFGIEFAFYETAVQTQIQYKKMIEVFTQNSVIIGLILSIMKLVHDSVIKWQFMISLHYNSPVRESICIEDSLSPLDTLKLKESTTIVKSQFRISILKLIYCYLTNSFRPNPLYSQIYSNYLKTLSIESLISINEPTSQMMQLNCFKGNNPLHAIDIFFSENFTMTAKGSRRFTSKVGGVLTLISLAIVIPICYFKIYEVANHLNPTIFINQLDPQQLLIHKEVCLNNTSIPFLYHIDRNLMNNIYLNIYNYQSSNYSELPECSDQDLKPFDALGIEINRNRFFYYCGNFQQDIIDLSKKAINDLNSYLLYTCATARKNGNRFNSKCNFNFQFLYKDYTSYFTVLNTRIKSDDQYGIVSTTSAETVEIFNGDSYYYFELGMNMIKKDTSIFERSQNIFGCQFSFVHIRQKYSPLKRYNNPIVIRSSYQRAMTVIQLKKVDILVIELFSIINLILILFSKVNKWYTSYEYYHYLIEHINFRNESFQDSLKEKNLNLDICESKAAIYKRFRLADYCLAKTSLQQTSAASEILKFITATISIENFSLNSMSAIVTPSTVIKFSNK